MTRGDETAFIAKGVGERINRARQSRSKIRRRPRLWRTRMEIAPGSWEKSAIVRLETGNIPRAFSHPPVYHPYPLSLSPFLSAFSVCLSPAGLLQLRDYRFEAVGTDNARAFFSGETIRPMKKGEKEGGNRERLPRGHSETPRINSEVPLVVARLFKTRTHAAALQPSRGYSVRNSLRDNYQICHGLNFSNSAEGYTLNSRFGKDA